MTQRSPIRYFKTWPEIIRLAVMLYVRFPLSLRSVENLLLERGIDVSHETVRFWWNRFGPLFAAEIRRERASRLRCGPQWRAGAPYPPCMTQHSPFRYFKTSPEIIRLAVMLYVCLPLSLRNVEELLHERSIDVSHKTVCFW